MRTLHELYLLLWEYIKDKKELNDGLCVYIYYTFLNSIFNKEEYDLIRKHIRKKMTYNAISYPYYFPDGETGTKQRKEFVLQMIEKTKP